MGSKTEENNEPVLLASIPSGKTSAYAIQAVDDWETVKSEYKLLSLEIYNTTSGLRTTNVCRAGARADTSCTAGSSSGVLTYTASFTNGTMTLSASSGNIANYEARLYGIK